MAAKINWHRYGTKLRYCHPMHNKYAINLFFKTILLISNRSSFRVLFDEIASIISFEKYIFIF